MNTTAVQSPTGPPYKVQLTNTISPRNAVAAADGTILSEVNGTTNRSEEKQEIPPPKKEEPQTKQEEVIVFSENSNIDDYIIGKQIG